MELALDNRYFIGYKLHKDGSHTGCVCDSLNEFNKTISELKENGYEYTVFKTEEELNSFVLEIDYSDKRIPSAQERWNKWALGK